MYIGVIMARLRSVRISTVFREGLYSSWRGWARLLLHCLRSIAGNSSGPPEEFCEIVFIAYMMSSHVSKVRLSKVYLPELLKRVSAGEILEADSEISIFINCRVFCV